MDRSTTPATSSETTTGASCPSSKRMADRRLPSPPAWLVATATSSSSSTPTTCCFPTRRDQVADVLCANPDIAKIQYRMEMIDAAGGRTGRIMPERYIPMPDGDLRAQALMFPADIPRMATSGNAFPAWVLQELAPIPETGDSVGADWYLAYISLLLGPVISIDGVGALYRTHGDNSFHASSLDLGQMRAAIRYIQYLHVHMKRHADRLGLGGMPDNPNEVRSVAFLAIRMVSLKLDPANHPIPEDTIASLLKASVAAVRLRFDVSFPMKVVFQLSFAALAVAPKPVARRLAGMIMQPQSRGRLNAVLRYAPPIPDARKAALARCSKLGLGLLLPYPDPIHEQSAGEGAWTSRVLLCRCTGFDPVAVFLLSLAALPEARETGRPPAG